MNRFPNLKHVALHTGSLVLASLLWFNSTNTAQSVDFAKQGRLNTVETQVLTSSLYRLARFQRRQELSTSARGTCNMRTWVMSLVIIVVVLMIMVYKQARVLRYTLQYALLHRYSFHFITAIRITYYGDRYAMIQRFAWWLMLCVPLYMKASFGTIFQNTNVDKWYLAKSNMLT